MVDPMVLSQPVPGEGIDRSVGAAPVGAVQPFGRRAFIAGAAGAVAGAALAPSFAGAATPEYSAFEALTPMRLCDTRPSQGDFGYTRVSDKMIRVQVTDRTVKGVTVPADATAAVFTLVGINRYNGPNYLAAFPAGSTWSGTANLNMFGYGNIIPNLVTVKLGAGGNVDVLAEQNADVVLDLVGVYRPTGGVPVREGRYQLLTVPKRALDTRDTPGKPGPGSTVRIDVSGLIAQGLIDDDAIAVSANITAVGATDQGYIAAYPFGEPNPGTSSLNVVRDETRGIGTMVKLGADTTGIGFNIFLERGAHLVVDIAGFVTGPSAAKSTTGVFVAVDPERVLDTRRGDGGKKRLWPGWTRSFEVPSAYRSEARAIAVNLAVTRTMGRGYFTLLGAQMQRYTVSNLNVTGPNQTVSNHAITQVSTKGVECYSASGGDVICDLVGYFKGGPLPTTKAVPVDPPPPPIAPPYYMEVPRLGLGRNMIAGSSDPIVDSGQMWHWTGTGIVGQGHAIATFGHRTEAGGPLRQIHTMQPGDQVTLRTQDQRMYIYQYNRREVTSKFPTQILAATQRIGGETLSIVACTVGNDSSKSAYPDPWAPTSLEYRIIVTLSLLTWWDVIPTT